MAGFMTFSICLTLITSFFFILPSRVAANDDPCAGGGALEQGKCAQIQLNTAEHKIQNLLLKLKAAATKSSDYNDKTVKSITTAQNNWVKFRDSECNLEYSLRTAAPTWNATYELYCKVHLTQERILKLKAHINCINQIGQACYE